MPATTDPANLAAVFKAYDVRGTVPDQVDEDLARAVGAAFVVGHRGRRGSVVGRARHAALLAGHGRAPSPRGAAAAGADVDLIGLASTDQLYFASGTLGLPGAMFTASHNPAQYNGIKMCRAYAVPVGMDTGLAEIRDLVAAGDRPWPPRRRRSRARRARRLRRPPARPGAGARPPAEGRRRRRQRDGRAHRARRLRAASTSTSCRCTSSSTAPSRTTRPTRSSRPTWSTCRRRVRETGADIGLAFDGDADRCFLVDERGELVSPSALTALIAARELAKEPGSTVIHNLITSRAVPEIVTELGGTPVRTRVGHSFIKATMAETGAVFGGEHSGHFYFRDFWRADSGMLAALHALAALAEHRRPAVRAARRVRPLRRLRRDQLHRGRPGRGRRDASSRRTAAATASTSTTSTGSPSPTTTGGSTSARPTPSRCSGSTPRPRTTGDDERIRDEVLAMIRSDA